MKVRAWTCGLFAVLMGCNSVDRSYEPPAHPTLLGDKTKVPPGSQPTWQQNQNPNLGYRGPGAFGGPTGPYSSGALGGSTGPYSSGAFGGGPTGSYSTPLGATGNQFAASGPGLGQASPALSGAGPAAPPQGVQTAGLSGSMGQGGNPTITQSGYNDNPIRVVPPSGAPAPGMSTTDRALSELTRPLPTPGTAGPGSDLGSKRRVMQPLSPSEVVAGGPPLSGGPALSPPPHPLLMAKQDDPAPAITQVKHEEKVVTHHAEHGVPGSPSVRMVNSKRIVLNYKVTDVGPSGVSAVELWMTRDSGHTWHKDESARCGPPCETTVPEEGMYGFTLVAKNGVGLGKNPPVAGDPPQVWVEVDLTKPVVSALDAKHGVGPKAREITITWSASDRNMARRPVTLSYAEKADGPWLPLAANIENSGHYVWDMPSNGPNSFLLRVEAADIVGNIGTAQLTRPVEIDTSRPTVSITDVEPGEK